MKTVHRYGLAAFLLLSILPQFLKAQVVGIVQDSTDQKVLAFATAALFSEADSLAKTPISATYTDEKGRFSLDAPAGTYRLEVVMGGYSAFILKRIELKEQEKKEIPSILLATQKAEQEAVQISALKPLIEHKEGKLIYNVENDPFSQGMTGIEVMKKVPFVMVDQEEKMRVKGQTNFKVLLNGKATGMMSKNPNEVLKSFPANAIKKIEVITNPSAKYDAEGATAVINIITKKQMSGYNGGAGGNVNTLKQGNFNANLNVKHNKIGISSFGSLGRWGNPLSTSTSELNSLSATNPYTQITQTQSLSVYPSGYFYAELAYDIDSLKSLSIYSSLQSWGGKSNSNSNMQRFVHEIVQEETDYAYNNQDKSLNTDFGADYIHKFKNTESEQEWTASLYYSRQKGNNQQQTEIETVQNKSAYQNQNNTGENELTISSDYVHPLSEKNKWGAGVKSILRSNDSHYENRLYNPTSDLYEINPSQTNDFSYAQNVYAAYGEYIGTFGKWTVKPGVRVEHTSTKGDFRSADTLIQQQYTNAFPTMSLTYKPNMSQSWEISYTKKLQRPGLYYLNPFVDNSNPLFVTFGNPLLKPEIAHNIELSYSIFGKFGSINSSLSHVREIQTIGNFSTLDATKNVMTTSYLNMGHSNSTGLNLNYSGQIKEKMDIYIYLNTSYKQLFSVKNNVSYQNSGILGYSFVNLGYKFGKDFTIGVNGNIGVWDILIQGNNPLWYDYGIRVAKKVYKKKLSLSLGINNPFNQYRITKSSSQDPSFSQSNVFSNPARSLRFGIYYTFGELKESVSRKRGVSNGDQSLVVAAVAENNTLKKQLISMKK